MARTMLVRDVMTKVPDVLTFTPDTMIEDAARALSERKLGGAPVVDDGGRVVGLLEDDDLIVQETRLHAPTVITVLGAYIPIPERHHELEEELRKAVGATVGQVMDADPDVCTEDETLERAATLLHDKHLSRLPVVRDGVLVGILSRGDLIRALLASPEG